MSTEQDMAGLLIEAEGIQHPHTGEFGTHIQVTATDTGAMVAVFIPEASERGYRTVLAIGAKLPELMDAVMASFEEDEED